MSVDYGVILFDLRDGHVLHYLSLGFTVVVAVVPSRLGLLQLHATVICMFLQLYRNLFVLGYVVRILR